MRTSLTTARTVLTLPRRVVRSTPNALSYPGTAGNYATFGGTNTFVSTQPFAFEAYLNMENYYDGSSGAQGVFSFQSETGVPLVFFMQNVAGIIIKIGGVAPFPSLGATGSQSSVVLSAIRKGWHAIAVTFDGTDYTSAAAYKFYIDGIEFALGSTAAPSATANLNTIGRLGATFHGKFLNSRLRVWSGGTAMTAAQVKSLYFDDVLPTGPTLVRDYRMTDGAGATITDISPQLTNATITGSVPWQTSSLPFAGRTVIATGRAIAG